MMYYLSVALLLCLIGYVTSKPNFVFILTDDQDSKMDSLNYMPKLKKYVAEQGVHIPHYFITNPLCAPSRASILRGQYTHNTKIYDVSYPQGGAQKFRELGEENSNLATWMHSLGYETALHGKYINGYGCNSEMMAKYPPGWSDWFALCDPHVYDYYGSVYSNNGKLADHKGEYQTETIGNRTLNFIETQAKANKPFFVYLSGAACHQPASPAHKYANLFSDVTAPKPPSYDQKDMSKSPSFIGGLHPLTASQENDLNELYRNRLRALQSVDDNVENIVELLTKLNILDNTYVFYSADNGFHLGEHRLPPGKREPYIYDTMVPLFIRGPGIAKNATSLINVQNIDLAPTIIELATGSTSAVPAFVDGSSFAKNIKTGDGNKLGDPLFRSFVFSEHYGESSSNPWNATWRKVALKNTWQHIRVKNTTTDISFNSWCTSQHEVYDLTKDSDEINNVFGSGAGFAGTMNTLLGQYFTCKADECKKLDSIGSAILESGDYSSVSNFAPLMPCGFPKED